MAENTPGRATCEDADGDGIAGLVLLEFQMRDVHTQDIVAASASPGDGDIDDGERHLVVIRVGNTAFTGWSNFYRSF